MSAKQNLLQLRTMNPNVLTPEVARQCRWAADMIEMLAAYVRDEDAKNNPEVLEVLKELFGDEVS